VGYTPETNLQLGGLVIYFFDLDHGRNLSSIPVLAIATLNEQLRLELRPEVFLDDNNYRLWTRFDLQRYPDVFFGVGSDTRAEDKEPYQRSFLRAQGNFRRRIVGDLHGGLMSDHMLLDLDVHRSDGLFATNEYVGEPGGTSGAVGPTLAYDSRDHNHYPTRGLLIEASVAPYTRLFGSDYSFVSVAFDARGYIPTYSGQLIALRYALDATGRGAPFYLLPQLGGPDVLRGYFRGRYRDTTAEVLEAEYRAQLFWRMSGVLFSGVGHVGPSYGAMWGSSLRPAFGTGLRYNMKKPDDIVNFRVDFGMWPWTSDFGLYVAAVEAF
jgi:outer membrane protein assembly factor BamA